jgi:uncharacterized phage protein (TIGR02220 family)
MENNTGWIKLHRAIMDHPDWLAEPFTRAQAWVDLLLLANHKVGHIRKRGILIEVQRGQVGRSEETLAARWKWSREKVRRFLGRLGADGQISRNPVQQNPKLSCLISIVNYEAYQSGETTNETTEKHQTVQEQECKNEKNNSYCQNALQILSYLNEKTGKRYRDTSFIEARLKDGGTIDECRKIIDTKMQDLYFKEYPKYLNPRTLFRKSHWDTYLNEALPLATESGKAWFKSPNVEAAHE